MFTLCSFPGYPHRQLRGFRREEHTAAHVLCLFEPIGRVTQSMGEKACATNRKRSMSAGIAEDSTIAQKYLAHHKTPLQQV